MSNHVYAAYIESSSHIETHITQHQQAAVSKYKVLWYVYFENEPTAPAAPAQPQGRHTPHSGSALVRENHLRQKELRRHAVYLSKSTFKCAQQAERLNIKRPRRERVVNAVEERARPVHAPGVSVESRIACLGARQKLHAQRSRGRALDLLTPAHRPERDPARLTG